MAYLQHSAVSSEIFSGRGMTVTSVSPFLSKASRERFRAVRDDNHPESSGGSSAGA